VVSMLVEVAFICRAVLSLVIEHVVLAVG
jgi:hypothetical protein